MKFGRSLDVRKVKNRGAGCKFPPVGNSCGAGTEEGDRLLVGGKGRGQRPEALHREIEPRSFFFSTYSSLSLSPSLFLFFPARSTSSPSLSIHTLDPYFFLSFRLFSAGSSRRRRRPAGFTPANRSNRVCLGRTRLVLVHGSWISLHLPRTTGVIVRLRFVPWGFYSRSQRLGRRGWEESNRGEPRYCSEAREHCSRYACPWDEVSSFRFGSPSVSYGGYVNLSSSFREARIVVEGSKLVFRCLLLLP